MDFEHLLQQDGPIEPLDSFNTGCRTVFDTETSSEHAPFLEPPGLFVLPHPDDESWEDPNAAVAAEFWPHFQNGDASCLDEIHREMMTLEELQLLLGDSSEPATNRVLAEGNELRSDASTASPGTQQAAPIAKDLDGTSDGSKALRYESTLPRRAYPDSVPGRPEPDLASTRPSPKKRRTRASNRPPRKRKRTVAPPVSERIFLRLEKIITVLDSEVCEFRWARRAGTWLYASEWQVLETAVDISWLFQNDQYHQMKLVVRPEGIGFPVTLVWNCEEHVFVGFTMEDKRLTMCLADVLEMHRNPLKGQFLGLRT